MATLSITIPDNNATRIIGDICTFWGYQPFIIDQVLGPIPNPETQNQFARRMVVQTMQGWVATVESNAAALAAAQAATNTANQLGIS